MKLFKRLFNFYISSNIHVAVATFCLVKITLIPHEIHENKMAWFVFFATVLSYNFIRYYNISRIRTSASKWIITHKKSLILLNLICAFGVLLFSFSLKYESIIWMLPFALATIFYSIPIYPIKTNLRSLATLKLFLIAFTWAGVTVLIPLIQHEISFDPDVWILFLQRFLFILAITIPFDLRDLNYDKIELKTLPQIIGKEKSKFVGIVAIVIFFNLELLSNNSTNQSVFTAGTISIITIISLYFSREKQSKYYSSFWVEGIPILWFLLLFLQTY